MDFLKKNPYPLAAYCFGLYSVLRIFSAGSVVSTLGLLAYIFLTVMLFLKRRDILTVIASAVPSVVSLLSIFIYGTTLLGFLGFVAGLLMPAYVACFLLPQLEPHVGKFMDKLKKLWFVPAVAQAALWLLSMITSFINFASWGGLEYFFQAYTFLSFLMTVLSIGGNLLLCNWMVWPDGLPEEWFASKPAQSAEPVYNPQTGRYDQPAASADSDLTFNLVAHILLLVFIGPIWQYIWIYRTTKALNGIPGEEDRNPVTKLLLSFFVPFYWIYWIYKSCKRIDKLAGLRGVSSDITTLCLILSFLIGIVPPIIMQEKMNAIAAASGAAPTYSAPSNGGYSYDPAPAGGYNGAAQTDVAPIYRAPAYDNDTNTKEKESFGKAPAQISAPADAQPAVPVYNAPVYSDAPAKDAELVQPADDVVEQLKKYKQLLDSGIITQEEFDAKKKRLLDL